jgi:hypothetical protein
MKRLVLFLAMASFWGAPLSTLAQGGMGLFQKPSLAKVFNPVVGKGALYDVINLDGYDQKPRPMEISIVGKELVDGKEAFWMEFVTTDPKGQTMYGKSLFTAHDFQFQRMIIQMYGQPAMEMPYKPNAARQEKMQESLNEWHSMGNETITVPVGTFSCEHWKNDKNDGQAWSNDKVTPFGMVKEVNGHTSMVLTKILTEVQDHITGPVQKFDPQQMMQQMPGQHPPKP